MRRLLNRFSLLPVPLKILLSFAVVILSGSLVLALPFSQLESSNATYFDHLFTAVSMVCVTGLFTEPLADTYNLFGQIIGLVLIKLGGLGLITIVATIVMQLGRRVSMKDEVTLQQALNRGDMVNFRNFLLSVVKYTFVIEGIGAFFLTFYFVPLFGWAKGLFTSIFLSISAFNNAGFDNLGSTSLQAFVDSPIVNTVIPLLIIVGGIGFSVWFDVAKNFKSLISVRNWVELKGRYRRLKLHTRLVINWTAGLIIAAMALFYFSEWNNSATLGEMGLFDKLQATFFQAVTLRTAGFGTVGYPDLHLFTILFMTVFMFIGGSPGGTAGGAKTSTVALVVKLIWAEITGQRYVHYQKRTIDTEIVQRALVIVVMFIGIVFVGMSLMAIFDESVPMQYLFFESVSALGTVGLSADLTPLLSKGSQTVIMCLMFIGRLGPITIFTALGLSDRTHKNKRYATGNILIG